MLTSFQSRPPRCSSTGWGMGPKANLFQTHGQEQLESKAHRNQISLIIPKGPDPNPTATLSGDGVTEPTPHSSAWPGLTGGPLGLTLTPISLPFPTHPTSRQATTSFHDQNPCPIALADNLFLISDAQVQDLESKYPGFQF